jgi:hypothetical protein
LVIKPVTGLCCAWNWHVAIPAATIRNSSAHWEFLTVKSIGFLCLCIALLSGCSKGKESAATTFPMAQAAAAAASSPMVVYKNASCGCCRIWVEHMRKAGFTVEVHDVDNLNPIKQRVGLPYGMGSCHTAEIGGYFIEGHVPAAEVQRLLTEKPAAKGLVVPGMPLGSPGMEQGDLREPYEVYIIANDGTPKVWAKYPK